MIQVALAQAEALNAGHNHDTDINLATIPNI